MTVSLHIIMHTANSSLLFWPYYMSSAHTISTHAWIIQPTSNQPTVVQEPEIQALRGKERQHGMGTFELLARCSSSCTTTLIWWCVNTGRFPYRQVTGSSVRLHIISLTFVVKDHMKWTQLDIRQLFPT